MSLPQRLPLELMQTAWGKELNPLIANPIMQGLAIYNIVLNANIAKTIPTTLSRVQLGWFPIDNTASCNVWRSEAFNTANLTLTASADTTISIWVF